MSLTLDPETVMHEAAIADFADLAGWLQDHLGQQLAAYVVGLRDPKVVGKQARHRMQVAAPDPVHRHGVRRTSS